MSSYAIIRASGSQHRVSVGERLTLNHLEAEPGGEIVLDEVLLIGDADGIRVGQPLIDGAKVTAKVLAHDRGPKIRVFKRRKRKGFHKTIGHRQELTRLEIVGIA